MTKGQTEAKISEALIKFEKEFMGRGPRETVSHIIKVTCPRSLYHL
ncbi:MAG: Na-translocating system protein MpsC family protein [Candidatus Scalindua sp.]|nr:Na-translocating system protein MpsC family protein [Candidatus Scalindua sp.]MDV5166172.1 Na-translocating system protein MpsC family protein [Candidatus Scalindua sp.]